MTQDYLEHLTPSQRAAVEHLNGAALVLAGPGSGKTRVITYRIIHLIREHKINPRHIVAITFTNKAANEMKERTQQLLPKSATNMLHISTFHSFCARLLRYEAEAAGLVKHYTICDDSDTKAYIVQAVALETEVDPKKVKGWKDYKSPDKVKRYISNKKQQLILPDDVFDALDSSANEEDLFYAKVYRRYAATLKKARSLDFDDLIMKTVLLLRENKEIRRKYGERIQYLLVDESQDTNLSQYELVKHLGSHWGNVLMVGDSDQCLLPSTEVSTPTGRARMDELKQGDKIVCAAGRSTTATGCVDEVYQRNYTGEVTTLVTTSSRKITGTPGHCIFSRPSHTSRFHHTYLRHPHHTPQATTTKRGKTRNTVTMTMFGSGRKQKNVTRRWQKKLKDPWYQHELSICSSAQNTEFRQQVEEILPTRAHKEKYWQARKSLGSYDDILALSMELEKETSATIRRRARITNEAYSYVPLAHVIPGMMVPIIDEGVVREEEVVTVEKSPYDGPVYDLAVGDFRNFTANGIVVHNSIYRFRGAQPENMEAMESDYPGLKTYFLEDNFRSTHQIANAANVLIAHNENRKPKKIKARVDGDAVKCVECLDPKQEAAMVVDQILGEVRREKAEWKDYAILYRMHTKSRIFEELMVTNNVPHRIIGGLGFYNRAIIKDIVAYLKLLLNGADDASFIRIYNKPARGFGETSYAKLYHLKEERDCHILTVFKKRYYEEVLKGRSLHGAAAIREVMAVLHQMPQDLVAPLIEKTIEVTRYRQILETDGEAKSLEKIDHLDELIKAAQEFDDAHGAGLLRFIEWTALMQATDEDTDENRVHLMTCHAAKGLEFQRLYVISAIDGVMPILKDVDDFGRIKSPEQMQKDLEEERRVFFVALTRAERQLTITHIREEFRYNSVIDCTPSRFLEELGDTVEHEIIAGTSVGSYLIGALNKKREASGRGQKKRGNYTYRDKRSRRRY